MKIYNKIVINIDSGAVLEEDSFEYAGPIVEAKGGSSGDNIDKDYNKRMATLSEKEFGMAQEYSNFWKGEDAQGKQMYNADGTPITSYRDEELAKLAGNAKLIGPQTDYQLNQINQADRLLQPGTDLTLEEIQSRRDLLPGQTGLAKESIEARRTLLPQFMGMTNVNATDVANRGVADVNQAYKGAAAGYTRDVTRTGGGMDMASLNAFMGTSALNKARDIGKTKADARKYADEESFRRTGVAMGAV